MAMSCANVMAPTGGDKDTQAPVLRSRSVPDSTRNFKGGNIVYEFDEFVQLKDVANQLVIAPLVKAQPTVRVHKRKVTVTIHDSLLLPNTTYQVQIGSMIQDIHEGNPVQNFHQTFSTGAYFDSLRIKGHVIQAENGLPDTSVWIVLYPEQSPDSAFYLEKPMYASKVRGGEFNLQSLPARKFRLYALQDQNNNLRYDIPGERIAFLDAPILPGDSNQALTLFTFTEESAAALDTVGGKRKLRKEGMSSSSPADKKRPEKFGYVVNVDTMNKSKRTFDVNDSLQIHFERPLKATDITAIRLYQGDVLDASTAIILDSSHTTLVLKPEWNEDATYTLKLMKNFAADSNGLNAMSGEFTFHTKRKSDYGLLTLQTTPNPSDWFELFRDNKLVARKPAKDSLIVFTMLLPGNYQLQRLSDENGNGKWDAGNLKKKIQPEHTSRFHDVISIKANWENKIRMDVINEEKGKKGKR
jgi:hypothetical protein